MHADPQHPPADNASPALHAADGSRSLPPKPGTTDMARPHRCIKCRVCTVEEAFCWDTGADLWQCPTCDYTYPRNRIRSENDATLAAADDGPNPT